MYQIAKSPVRIVVLEGRSFKLTRGLANPGANLEGIGVIKTSKQPTGYELALPVEIDDNNTPPLAAHRIISENVADYQIRGDTTATRLRRSRIGLTCRRR